MRPADVERLRGRWIATDCANENVVADAASLEQLRERLAGRTDAILIRRIPTADEPIFVGFY
jgi:hypothetical protein